MIRAALECGDAGPAHLEHLVVPHHVEEALDLLRLTGELHDETVRGEIDDLRLVDPSDVAEARQIILIRTDLDKQELPLHTRRRKLIHLAHILEPPRLKEQLLQLLLVDVDRDRDPRDARIHGLRGRDAVDVEAPAVKHIRDSRQHTVAVHRQDADDPAGILILMLHHTCPLSSSVMVISCTVPPGGIIGSTFSSLSIRHSIQLGPSLVNASARAARNSAMVSQR